jgi:hypothetical protein
LLLSFCFFEVVGGVEGVEYSAVKDAGVGSGDFLDSEDDGDFGENNGAKPLPTASMETTRRTICLFDPVIVSLVVIVILE